MTEEARCYRAALLLVSLGLFASAAALAGYKVRPWVIRARDSYPAFLTSEGVTIAVDPLYKDELAAQVFDKNDIVTRGIMPLAVIIFNDNNYPIAVEGGSIELIQGEEHLRSLPVNEVVQKLFQKSGRVSLNPLPRRPSLDSGNQDALLDFEHKLLGRKIIWSHDKGGGFLYLQIPRVTDLPAYLSKAQVYIPEVARQDTGANLIFFEIDVKPAIDAVPAK